MKPPCTLLKSATGCGMGPKLERKADKMREIVAMLGWLTPLYFVCVLCKEEYTKECQL